MGKKRILGWAALIAAAAAAAAWAPDWSTPGTRVAEHRAPVKSEMRQDRDAAPSRLSELPAREIIGKRRGELFPPQSWAPPPQPPAATAPALTAPPEPPAPPPMPYRVAGKVVHEGGAHIVLAKGDRVITVREGDTLEDGYRVDRITAQSVTLSYLALGVQQQLPVNIALETEAAPGQRAAAAPPEVPSVAAHDRPAQLRWEGPAQIKAGDSFNVALKVTSPQAVRSAPLQVNFDAEVLEAVAVRRGVFFADGNFSYRINPAGSIFIGATGKGAVPADAEFFVVTFKPVRPGATAELKLSSVLLQGAAGRAIAHDQPAAFRTAIVQ